ncbi:tyrosine-type recombinase/integrase [Streptomyces griseoincarnatus]
MHALRHFYASVLLDAGESIKALAEYLGHSDPGLTLKVYAHLMPSSRERARRLSARHSGRTARRTEGPEWSRAVKMPPIRAVCAGGRHDHWSYFFLPWFFTASIAAAAASGSRYLPPGVTGLKSASSS